jgi:hypothetical protein
MAASLVQGEFVYTSGTSAEQYMFTVAQDSSGNMSVRDIQNAYGLIANPYSHLPASVTADIEGAITAVESIMAASSAINGTLTFAAQNHRDVTFVEALAGTTYRVQLSSQIFVPLRITNKTTTGFTVQAGADVTGDIGYDVFM